MLGIVGTVLLVVGAIFVALLFVGPVGAHSTGGVAPARRLNG